MSETLSDLAARERAAALDAIRGERIVVLDAVEKERIATLHEIEAIAQRLADRSGPLLHGAARTDLKDLVSSVEEMRRRLIVEAGDTLKSVVDHAFFRLVQLLLICAGLVALGLVLYICFFRRRRWGRDVQS